MKKDYQATFILDTRKWNEPIEALVNQIKQTVEEINGTITSVKDLGLKSFSRQTRRDFVEGYYVCIQCSADSEFNKLLQKELD